MWFEMQEIQEFVLENRIVSAAVGWVIAISVAQTIQSAVGDVVLPSIYFLVMYLSGFSNFAHLSKLSPIFEGAEKINLMRFLKEVISLCLVFLLTFAVINYLVYSVIPQQKAAAAVATVAVAAPPTPPPSQTQTWR